VFQAFDTGAAALGLVRFHTVAQVAGRGCSTLARFSSGEPALIECAAGAGRGLVLASDLNDQWNDFPLHPTFVPFLHEAVRYLASTHRSTSDYIVGAQGVPETPGIVRLASDVRTGAPGRQVAVNVDPRESDPSRLSTAEFEAAVTRLKAAARADARVEATQQEDRQHLWQYVIVLMVLALAVEGIVASRTA
jgi:hypothetical protein